MMLNKRFCLLILTLLLVFPLSAPAESDYWICPECGVGKEYFEPVGVKED